MAGERDVLAEALHELHMNHGRSENRKQDRHDADDLLLSLAARSYTLSKSAPDPEPPRDRINEANALGYREGYRAAEAAHKVATPPAEPPPREALDVAWAELRAAIPHKRWTVYIHGDWEDGWEAEVTSSVAGGADSITIKTNNSGWFHDPGELPGPTEALRALAAALSLGEP